MSCAKQAMYRWRHLHRATVSNCVAVLDSGLVVLYNSVDRRHRYMQVVGRTRYHGDTVRAVPFQNSGYAVHPRSCTLPHIHRHRPHACCYNKIGGHMTRR